MILTAVFRLCGQFETGPTAVCDQSNVRINAPISPPPEKTESIAVELMLSLFPTPSSAVSGSWARCSPTPKSSPRTPYFSVLHTGVARAHALGPMSWILKSAALLLLAEAYERTHACLLRGSTLSPKPLSTDTNCRCRRHTRCCSHQLRPQRSSPGS